MEKQDLILSKLTGYSGIRLKQNKPLHIKSGINLLVGRNGSGKTNLIHLIHSLSQEKTELNHKIESAFFKKQAEKAIKKQGNDISSKFGVIEILKYSFNDVLGSIRISVPAVKEEYVLKNLIEPGAQYHHQIVTTKTGPPIKVRLFHSGASTLELDFGGSLDSKLLSSHKNHDLSSIIQEPIGTINEFIYGSLLDFFNSQQFEEKLRYLEKSINDKLSAFFGTTNKKIVLSKSSHGYMRVKPILIDGENEIQPGYISAGEAALLNLIFNLASPEISQSDILAFDEPEIHMHDDMISVFVKQIIHLSNNYPNCKILIASHSTSLIEKFSYYGIEKAGLIVFNEHREVANSDEDIDLINALNRNGVWFSPLMLSKRHNLYIENQGNGENSHKDFYSRFFNPNDRPNIIPIGSGASVEQSQSFSETLQELIKSSDIKSKGIRDGDIWVKEILVKYLRGQIKLTEFIDKLSKTKDLYIRVDKKKRSLQPDYYFNLWEIENLYLTNELIGCWKLKTKSLTLAGYHKLLLESKDICTEVYLDVFYKTLYPRHNKRYNLKKKIEVLNEKLAEAEKIANDETEICRRAKTLVDELITSNLTQWLPGKEIKGFLESNDYTYDDSDINFDNLKLSTKVREILLFSDMGHPSNFSG